MPFCTSLRDGGEYGVGFATVLRGVVQFPKQSGISSDSSNCTSESTSPLNSGDDLICQIPLIWIQGLPNTELTKQDPLSETTVSNTPSLENRLLKQ